MIKLLLLIGALPLSTIHFWFTRENTCKESGQRVLNYCCNQRPCLQVNKKI